MNIKPSKTVRCMSHTNTDTVKRQRESKGAGMGKGQRKFCWPSFKNRWIYLTTWSVPAFCSRNTWSSSQHVAVTFHSQNWASYEEPDISILSLALEYIPAGVPQGSNLGTPKFHFFFFVLYSNTERINPPWTQTHWLFQHYLNHPLPEELDW